MTDLSHLDALQLRLSHERGYLAAAKTDTERAFRFAWIAQIEKEIADEKRWFGIADTPAFAGSDDDLLAELMA